MDRVGSASSSSIVTAVSVNMRLPEDPVTDSVSWSSSRSSSSGVRVKVLDPEATPAGMVTVKSSTSV